MGRGFTQAEGLPGSPSVIVLSDGLWRRRFGADPELSAVRFRCREVRSSSVSRRLRWDRCRGRERIGTLQDRSNDRIRGGRYAPGDWSRAPGVSRERAQVEMSGIAASLEKGIPTLYR